MNPIKIFSGVLLTLIAGFNPGASAASTMQASGENPYKVERSWPDYFGAPKTFYEKSRHV